MSNKFEEIVLEKLKGIDILNEKIDGLKEDVKELRQDVDGLKEDVKELRQDVDGLKEKFNELNETTNGINGSVVIIEDKVNKDLPLLYEIYSLNYSFQKQNETKVNSLEQEVFNNSNKISNLEIITDKHSKQLKKLIS